MLVFCFARFILERIFLVLLIILFFARKPLPKREIVLSRALRTTNTKKCYLRDEKAASENKRKDCDSYFIENQRASNREWMIKMKRIFFHLSRKKLAECFDCSVDLIIYFFSVRFICCLLSSTVLVTSGGNFDE